MRRQLSIFCLFLAWLCANGAVWNVVQVIGWAKMFHDHAQVMSVADALEATFDGSAPCALCHISQTAEDAARQQLPREADLGNGVEKLLFVAEVMTALVVPASAQSWPEPVAVAGLTRTELVPVPPPRV